MKAVIVGIDLAGTPGNPTGWAAWKNKNIAVCQLHTDEEIVTHSTQCEPEVIAVDAPLSLPLEGDLETRVLTSHELDAVTAAFTGYLYTRGKVELVGDNKEGFIVVPTREDWRKLKL